MRETTHCSLGIDFGTSGARAIAINNAGDIQAQANFNFSQSTGLAGLWQNTLFELLGAIPREVRRRVGAIAINGTSSTVLMCDDNGNPLFEPLLYNDARGETQLEQVRAIAPSNHTVVSATSSLAKLLWLNQELQPTSKPYLMHQADWLGFLLHQQLGVTDYHNALKLGYDIGDLRYPDWMESVSALVRLPRVVAPGSAIASVSPAIATQYGFPETCLVHAGTTDSIAAFLASGAQFPGEAVTSLGSTLVLKLLSKVRVDDARRGIYSHRLGDLWLVGGASNTGGAVLRQFFTHEELQHLSQQINPDEQSPLDYYPLVKPGERFPINDPNLLPRLEPRPDRPIEFLHGLLESIARIEATGYKLLQALGATPLTQVYTAGGGAKNTVWSQMRSRHLGVPILPSAHTEAAYGTALLAMGRGRC
ncbi:FGGY-family carbohydrate kinase [Oscillatoria sp. FACHB-1407]|uniref:FGGY-family carbohydrate kinase n=1 Tax=Oscillatoria sp. FACHB-1407 TaxID=2692847 RepID=UPI0016838AEE|nr:FGGY-family carbohydrate kinase [Oscillatoria sp. FACHB-1407]MBD2463983.1 FGGY-family carbohydrate kinase [Oscillatoria sp. FACHB-1407]